MDIAWTKEAIEELLTEMAGDPEDPKERKKRRIVASARELFSEQGYRKTSVDEIARHAHVAKGTVYLYFKSKPDLLLGVLAAAELEVFEQFLPLFDETRSVLERFEMHLREGLLFVHRTPLYSKLLAGDRELMIVLEEAQTARFGPDAMTQFLKAFLAPLRDELGWSDEVFDIKTHTIIAVTRALPQFLDERGRDGLDIETFASSIAELLTHGLLGALGGRSQRTGART